MSLISCSNPSALLNYPKPREGTETRLSGFVALLVNCSRLNYPKPREGTETSRPRGASRGVAELNYPKPREGTET